MVRATDVEQSIRELEAHLREAVDSHPPLALTPAWFQERLLEWATDDPDFRVKLLRFVDVLPTLRTPKAVADHVRQYFRGSRKPLAGAASEVASAPVFRPVLSQIVRQGVFSMAGRFIAGSTPEEALPKLRELAEDGVAYTVDLLGERTLSEAEGRVYKNRYLDLITTLADAGIEMGAIGDIPQVNVSIKVSALFPHLEVAAPEWVSREAREPLREILHRAMERGIFVNFDMEQYAYRELVTTAFSDLLLEPEFASYPHVGIVVQAYLRDAEEQIALLRDLAQRRGAPVTVRLVKGAYWDEECIVAAQNGWPTPVWLEKHETDDSFDRCTDALLAAYPDLRPAFGTHNPHSIAQAIVKARNVGLERDEIEFQMLYGMAEGLRERVAEDGWRTRVYVPLGAVIPGMAYLVRRLLENTSNEAWFNAGAGMGSGNVIPAKAQMHDASPAHTDGHHPAPAATLNGIRNSSPTAFFRPEAREQMAAALDNWRQRFVERIPLLIGEDEVRDRPEATAAYTADPATTIAVVAQATREDVDRAVSVARAAWPTWRDTPASERAKILAGTADILEDRRFDLAALMVYESGKPWHEADGDVSELADYLRYYGRQAVALETPRVMGDVPGEHNEYSYSGRGVAAIIAPWNFPLAIIGGMSAGALAGGNAAILKPAGQSPVIAYELVRILREAGVPPEVVQYLPGPGAEVGQALVEHPGIDIIAFTGSSAVGLGMIEAAARTKPDQANVKRVIAEMGGKNAIIVDDDADLDQAIDGVVRSAFGYAGQKCSACSRLIIVGSAYDEATARLRDAVESLVVGPPHEPQTFVPPVVDAKAREKIQDYIDGAKEYATLLAQGDTPDSQGNYVRPTVFTDVPLDSPLAREEVFGPVLAVFRAETFEQALEIAADSAFALTGGVYSRNPRHIDLARRQFRAGSLYINRPITGGIPARQPFGGSKMSGIGEKAGGPDYVRQFMEPRTVTENTVRRGFAPEE